MPLPTDVEQKIMNLGRGEAINRGFLDIFNAMVNESDIDLSPSKTMVLPLYDASSNLQSGDWAAELHFVVRKVGHVEEKTTP